MRATVTKTFRFEAAHHLPKHDGKCRYPHGHSYRVKVEVDGAINTQPDHPKEGMVIDFGDIKSIWKEKIEPWVDHRDLNEVFTFATTAENLAAWMVGTFHRNGIAVTKVTVWETETSSASVTYSEVWANGSDDFETADRRAHVSSS